MIVNCVAVGDDGDEMVYAWGTVRVSPEGWQARFIDVPACSQWRKVFFVVGGMEADCNVHGPLPTSKGQTLTITGDRFLQGTTS